VDSNGLIYLDHAATTPVRPEVLEAMLPYFSEIYGNPSSLYPLAIKSHQAVETARLQVADVLHCRASEIVFTSGGTESDNASINGVAQALKAQGNHIITSSIEHHAVLNTCRHLERQGFQVTYLPVDKYGIVDPDDVARAVTNRTILVSIMYANNEIGTIEPIREISRAVRERSEHFNTRIPVHTDAIQAAGYLDLDVDELGVDLLSLSAHKFYGPKGCGVLYVRRETPLEPIQLGGGQEHQRRSGTENVAGIVGAGLALQLATGEREITVSHCAHLRDTLIAGMLLRIQGARINGHPYRRLANNAHFVFKELDGEAIVLGLAKLGIAGSTGSACSTGSPEPSHVLEAIGIDRELAWGSLRISLGLQNTIQDVEQLLEALPTVARRIDGSPVSS
jgi:cysteine desulfurase